MGMAGVAPGGGRGLDVCVGVGGEGMPRGDSGGDDEDAERADDDDIDDI